MTVNTQNQSSSKDEYFINITTLFHRTKCLLLDYHGNKRRNFYYESET